MITTIILSKDRPAQLELLLHSLDVNGGGVFDPVVVLPEYTPEVDEAVASYGCRTLVEHVGFEAAVRSALSTANEFSCFMCDDGILYRPSRAPAIEGFREDLLCFSLRLGYNTTTCYPSGLAQPIPKPFYGIGTSASVISYGWRWVDQLNEPGVSDFGYPGSVDGHVFRTTDLALMLEDRRLPNPTALECAMVDGCTMLAGERPLMACYPHSVYVGNPVNRVSKQSGVRFATKYSWPQEHCLERFRNGERIDLDALDFSQVNGAHTEIELKWTQALS